ncbi:hypothetical protein RRG08_011602 [Elysia crispata]|nr:hypothetical protein RRG08_011602 [Elysia crispata]
MITPYGRFRWTRLHFGLNVSSAIFQRHLTQALEGLEDCINVTIEVRPKKKQREIMRKNLKMLKERCKDKGIKLNPNKASEKQEEVTMGHSISAKGVQPETSKIEAIEVLKMPAPQDIHDVRRFCGMVQYLAKFLGNISEVLCASSQRKTRRFYGIKSVSKHLEE